ncbi:MAG: ABC transporter permease subunit [Bordetella sp.]|nr:MAG: ABC transporter permease subunit [Bordetella sp.]
MAIKNYFSFTFLSSFNWNNPRVRSFIYQFISLIGFSYFLWFLISNTLNNLSDRNISTGFGFMNREAGFLISDMIIRYTPDDTYRRALLVGLTNTLRIAIIGIILSTFLGILLGISRLSKNWLLSKISYIYIEIVRNIPLLLQIFFWYALITENMPNPKEAINPLPGMFISNRGIRIPSLNGKLVDFVLEILIFNLFLIIISHCWNKQHFKFFIKKKFPILYILILSTIFHIAIYFNNDLSFYIDFPVINRFDFHGGIELSSEFIALLISLVIYSSAFIAEVVRSGIQAINQGQWEAAHSLGLSKIQILRLIIFPQSLRVIIPPMISQFLNLTKNSSLAVAIGYPDIVSISNTIINQTGQAIEGILIIVSAYLTISLSISIFMNLYNKHVFVAER